MPGMGTPPLAAPGDPAVVGQWEPVQFRFQYLPVHVALMRTGKVLAFGGSGNDELSLNNPHPAEVWDPINGNAKVIDQKLDGDIFCAGQVRMADGRILVAGGTYKYDNNIFGIPAPPFTGLDQAYTFDPDTESWTRIQDMRNGRWYPTLVALADGRTLCVAGLSKGFPWMFLKEIEVYSDGVGWSKVQGADRWLPLYPRLHLLPNGDVFYSGSYNTHYTFPFSLNGFPTTALDIANGCWKSYGLPNKSEREEGATVLLPLLAPDYKPVVLLTGGGTPQGKQATNAAEVIDLSVRSPSWRQIQPMAFARYYAYSVMLPDQTVFVCGGRIGTAEMNMSAGSQQPLPPAADLPHDPMAILDTELFDPKSETWTKMAPMTVDRLYHSNALLLPDGRVMTCGSNPARRTNELRIEVYRPPYLFKGPRPTITTSPQSIQYGQQFSVKVDASSGIGSVALIKAGATTHCVNTDQRYLGLEFSSTSTTELSASMPANRNLAPPGFYLLFVVSQAGVPSVGSFVRVG